MHHSKRKVRTISSKKDTAKHAGKIINIAESLPKPLP
jgi:hypothetical protein